MKECVICRGSGIVRMSVYKSAGLIAKNVESDLTAVEELYRTYPCPECIGQQIADEKVVIVQSEHIVSLRHKIDLRSDDTSLREHVARRLACETADYLLLHNLIDIREEVRGEKVIFKSRLGVVSRDRVTSIERRQRQP